MAKTAAKKKKLLLPSERALLVIGIDPGLNGAVAVLEYHRGSQFKHVFSMPTEEKRSGRRQVDAGALYSTLLSTAGSTYPFVRVIIEQVSAMPRQGVSGMFSLGDSFGTARGVVQTLCPDEFLAVSPLKWKGYYGLLKKKKTASLTLARRLFPDARPFLMRKKDEGRAEALLIAHYARLALKW